MRKRTLTRGVVGAALLAGTFTLGSTALAAASGATVIKPHVVGTYDAPLIATRQRELWPYVDPSRFTVSNVSLLQQTQFRPLYWFGLGKSTSYQPALSMANTPVFSGGNKVVTIKLKGWKFYNAVTHTTSVIQAKNIALWFNIAKSAPEGYGGYTPGYGIPDQVKSTKIVNATTFQITLKSATNPTWFLYNALATVTPMPSTWDTTDISDSGYKTHTTNCETQAFTAVALHAGSCYAIYNAFSDDTNNFAVDNNLEVFSTGFSGPFMMTNYHYAADSTYDTTLAPNPQYSGPVKAKVNVKWHFYTTLSSEISALQAGNVLDVGTSSPDLVTKAPKPGLAGTNSDPLIAANYNARSATFWGFSYAYINFGGHATHQALLKQQYIRAALTQAINQKGIVNTIYNNYATTNCTALPQLNDPFLKGVVCPYPFSTSKAKALLTSHGWSGASAPLTCTKATGCGAGIPKNTKLNLNFEYITAGPTSPFDTMIATEKSQWANAGINVSLNPTTEAAVSNDCLGMDTSETFDLCEYGGWVYSPGAFPSGEQLFFGKYSGTTWAGAASNAGFVNDAKMNSLIKQTISTNTALTGYAKYTGTFIPVLYQPSGLGVGELKTTVHGAQPINPISDFNPEYITAV